MLLPRPSISNDSQGNGSGGYGGRPPRSESFYSTSKSIATIGDREGSVSTRRSNSHGTGGGKAAATSTTSKRSTIPETAKISVKDKHFAGKKAPPPKKKPSPACCTVPLMVLFLIACVLIAVVFTAITTVSSITFTDQVEFGIKRSLKLSLESAMREIISPLLRSVIWVNQMKVMIESSPKKYACDDGNITSLDGNASNAGLLYEAGMYALQRPTLHHIYQTRLSSRFTTPNGTKRPVVCLVAPPQTDAFLFANGTRISMSFDEGGSVLENIGTSPSTTSDVDIINLSFAREPVETVEPRWLSGPIIIRLGTNITILSVERDNVETKFSYMVNVTDPSDPTTKWGVGIDHNMKSLQIILRQATPPIQLTLATANESETVSTYSQVSGAHTSIYNMYEGVLMSSTHPDVPVVQTNGKMYKAGQTPVYDVNRAYNAAIELCGTTDCAMAEVVIRKERVQTVLRYYEPDTGLHLLLVTSVPRSYYFDDADRTFAIVLGLSVGSFVLVASGCIALLVLLHRPLSSLKRNMIEAAELHNDRVEHTSTYLRDIAQLSAVFDGMNQQLLIARSFVPEAVLLGKTEDSQEDLEDEGSVSDDIHTNKKSSRAHTAHSRGNEPAASTLDGITTNVSSNNSSNGMAKLFNVAEKRVGVLSLNLLGFHNLCAPERSIGRAQKINELSTDLLELAVACAHSERGVMDSFHGDHFTLTFNASRAVAGPLAAAVRTASAFIAGVSESPMYRGCGGVAAGAASGRAHVGTFGIDGYRRMSVVGEAYRTATTLQTAAVQLLRMNAGMRAGCMIDEAALKELGNCALHLQLTACLQSSAHRAHGGKTPAKAYFAHPVDQDENTMDAMKADGEWLYELDAIEATNPFLEPNRAMIALMEGNTTLCGELIDAHLAAAAKCHNSPLGGGSASRSMSMTASDGDCSGDLMEITQIDDCNPAWAFVRRQHLAMALATNGEGDAVDDATSNAKCFRIPWVVFHQ